VNFRTLGYSSIVYTMFNLMKEIRDLDLYNLAAALKGRLAANSPHAQFKKADLDARQTRRAVNGCRDVTCMG
jgi:hypothetical protein